MNLLEENTDEKIVAFIKERFVHVNKKNGLTENDCIKAIEFINQPMPD